MWSNAGDYNKFRLEAPARKRCLRCCTSGASEATQRGNYQGRGNVIRIFDILRRAFYY
jgi:hypothetical protein